MEILNNRTRLDDLDGKTDELLMGSMEFERFGRDMKRKMLWERTKLIVIFGIGALVFLASISSQQQLCITFSLHNSCFLINFTFALVFDRPL